jgi:membrane-associated phospholipid phosphatase
MFEFTRRSRLHVFIAQWVRRSEWILWAFLVYAALMAIVAHLPQITRVTAIGLNIAILVWYILLVYREAVRPHEYLRIARDWLPLLLVPLAYKEMGWFAVPHPDHSMEAQWVTWDHVVLRGGARAVIESLGVILPSILEIAYLLLYVLAPFSVAMLYVYDRRDRVDRFLFLFLTAVLLCYAQFPFWPSEPPRTLFPTEDLPRYVTLFRRWNLSLVEAGGIHTSVFPSAHVAAAVAVAVGMRICLPEHKWISRSLGVTAAIVTIATVYGRYHYLADAGAGVLMAGVACLIARLLPPVGTSRRIKTEVSPEADLALGPGR